MIFADSAWDSEAPVIPVDRQGRALEVLIQVGTSRFPLYAGLALIVAGAVTGCAAGSSTGGGSSTSAAASPLAEVKLAALTSTKANSFTGTMNLKMAAAPGASSTTGLNGDLSMTARFTEQLHPSLFADVNIESLADSRTTMPGGIEEIVTPTGFYMKWSYLTQALHLTKPWVAIPFSSLSKTSGVDLSQLMNQATSNSPLTQTRLFADANSVRQVGTGTIDGVPVTEYTGKVPMDKALSRLSGTLKTQVQQQMQKIGFSTEKFTVWIDDQHLTRKAIISVDGTSLSETISMTITSINQPVNVTPPPASETSPLPAGALG